MSDKAVGLFPRASGILLHITSLPGEQGIGDFGTEAYRFVDFLSNSRQRLWQILPLQWPGWGESPYAALSAFAGNPLLISLPKLFESGLLQGSDLVGAQRFSAARVDYRAVRAFKFAQLRRAYERFAGPSGQRLRGDFENFCRNNAFWLDDFALFIALKDAHKGAPWWAWEQELISRQADALTRARSTLAGDFAFCQFLQYMFFGQWYPLKAYANGHQVQIIGDVPIFVAHDSADVWAHQRLFALDQRGNPTIVAGVPPDFFSATGQRWGNPLYRWDVIASEGYQWWINRMREALHQVDIVRIDHFRGFESYWEIPAANPTAENGRWVKGPGAALFRAIEGAMGSQRLPIIVEDLGSITPEVLALRDLLGYPGMKVLQFAFGSDATNPYLPHNYNHNCVVYTATHDNDTTVGWYNSINETEKRAVRNYLGKEIREINWDLIRLAFRSVANQAIAPLQDVLGLGSEARMNFPGRAEGNWAWRYTPDQLGQTQADRLRELTTTYLRIPV